MITPTMRAMAEAVLREDEGAALALADMLQEARDDGLVPVLSDVRELVVDGLKAVFFVDHTALGVDITVDEASLEAMFQDWAAGRRGSMALVGMSRVEFYRVVP